MSDIDALPGFPEPTPEEMRAKGYQEGFQAALDARKEIEARLSLPAPESERGAVAWLYELVGKSGEVANVEASTYRFNTAEGISPFGRAGINYHEEGTVRETPLYTHPAPSDPRSAHAELSEVVYAAGDTPDSFVWPCEWGDPVEADGFVILRGDPKLREWIKLMLDQARCPHTGPVSDPRSDAAELREVCAEAYQVVGSLLSDLGKFDTPEGDKILDNLSQFRLVHKDVLPWPSYARATQARAPEGWHDPTERVRCLTTDDVRRAEAKGMKVESGPDGLIARWPVEGRDFYYEDAPAASSEVEANLTALLRYSGDFYSVAIEHGIPAGQAANAVAHIERAARRLAALAAAPTPKEAG